MQSNLSQAVNLLKAKGISETMSKPVISRRMAGRAFYVPKDQEVWIDKPLQYVPTALELKRVQWLFG